MKVLKIVVNVVLMLLFVVGGAALAGWLVETKPKAGRIDPAEKATLVRVESISPGRVPLTIKASGTVQPARVVVVMPEVSGRVVSHHSELVKGGRIPAGAELLRIDETDYQIAVSRSRSALSQAKTALTVEKGRKRVAEREWNSVDVGAKADPAGKALALREPYIKSVKASISQAQSALRSARRNIEKTVITAPFNAVVQDETVEVSQLVGPASRLAVLAGTDEYWVELAVPVERLQWITIPGVNTSAKQGSRAIVSQRVGGRELARREGYVERLLPDLDQAGKMARLLVTVKNPLGLKEDGTTEGLPLLLGAFAEVEIAGGALDNVARIPRAALREGREAWVMGADQRMKMVAVDVRWREREFVLVRGLEAGSKVIVSNVATPVPEMLLKLVGDPSSEPKPKEAAAGGEPKDAGSAAEVGQ